MKKTILALFAAAGFAALAAHTNLFVTIKDGSVNPSAVAPLTKFVTNQAVTASFVQSLGFVPGAHDVVLHYSTTYTNFVEGAADIYAKTGEERPVYLLVDSRVWYSLANKVDATMSGIPYRMLTFGCMNSSNALGGFLLPSFVSAQVVPALNMTVSTFGSLRLLQDSYTSLTNSASFRSAVQAVGGGGGGGGSMDYVALTNTVNRVKELHYDPGLHVTWTNVVNNGHIYYVTVTNTNVSTL